MARVGRDGRSPWCDPAKRHHGTLTMKGRVARRTVMSRFHISSESSPHPDQLPLLAARDRMRVPDMQPITTSEARFGG